MSMGDPLTFTVHRAGPVDWEKGQLCADCKKPLPLSYAASWPEGGLVGVGNWLGAVPYPVVDRKLAEDEARCVPPGFPYP